MWTLHRNNNTGYRDMLKVLPGLSQDERDGVPGSQEFVDMGLVTEC